MTQPRGIEERLEWFLSHNPAGPGLCAQHSWHALGGSQSPPSPPAWGCSDANECVSKVKASGRYWTPQTWSGPPPRGAWVGFAYGSHGHAALSNGDGTIVTTDPSNGKPVGTESLDYAKRWGFSTSNGPYSVWSDQYAGVRFQVDGISHGDVYLSKLAYGQMDSDSVRRLQAHLNDHVLLDGSTLPISGNLLDQTAHELRLDREQHGFANSIGDQTLSKTQAQHIIPFGDCGCILHDDSTPEPPDPPEPPLNVTVSLGIEYSYSGKPPGTLTFSGSYKRLDVDSWAPKKDGLTIGMLYANVDGEGEFRTRLVRENPSDATSYQTHYAKSGDNYLLTHVWFESGEGGRPLHYEFCSMDGTTHTVTTRYAKFATIPWEAVETMAAAGQLYADTAGPLRQLLAAIFKGP